jgi:hypothetical protein
MTALTIRADRTPVVLRKLAKAEANTWRGGFLRSPMRCQA